MITDELQRAAVQLLAFSVIPFIWWAVWRSGTKNPLPFLSWIGLKKSVITNKKKFGIFVISAVFVAVLMSLVLDPILPDDIQLANAHFGGQGSKALIPALIFSFFATALPEEIFFRGFLGKRFTAKFGFFIGNTIQAVLFGLLHGATMFPALGAAIPLLVISFTGLLGWLMGSVNEKAGGSVIPSWCLHGVSNLYAVIIIMFELL